jgi:hypothetical protein
MSWIRNTDGHPPPLCPRWRGATGTAPVRSPKARHGELTARRGGGVANLLAAAVCRERGVVGRRRALLAATAGPPARALHLLQHSLRMRPVSRVGKTGFFFNPAQWVFWFFGFFGLFVFFWFFGFLVFLYIFAQKREFLGFFQFQEYF